MSKFSILRAISVVLFLYLAFWTLYRPDIGESISSFLLSETIGSVVVFVIVMLSGEMYGVTLSEMRINPSKRGSRLFFSIFVGIILWLVANIICEVAQIIIPIRSVAPNDSIRIYTQSSGLSRIGVFFFLVFMGPFSEEIFFRGLLYSLFNRGFCRKASVILSSLIFSLFHIYPLLMIFTFVIGCGFSWLREHEQSMQGPIVAHITVNFISLI